MKRLLFIVALLLVAWFGVASAQSTGQYYIEFIASADHNAAEHGTALLTRYEMRVTQGSTNVVTSDLGKPTPGAGNLISVERHAVLSALPRATYNVVIAAIGPGGEAVSPPFSWTPAAPRSPAAPTAAPSVVRRP